MNYDQRIGFLVTICSALLCGHKEASKHAEFASYTKAVSDAESILEMIESCVSLDVASSRQCIESHLREVLEDLKNPELEPIEVRALHHEAQHLLKLKRRPLV
jgi:hypothetical protein